MPGRDPEALKRSAQIGAAVHAEMKRQGLTGVELRKRIEELRGAPVGSTENNRAVWLSRRISGKVNLVKPVRVVYGPTDDLADICKILGVKPERIIRVSKSESRTAD
jgi:DNA-binding Xre family transcriptional regulator